MTDLLYMEDFDVEDCEASITSIYQTEDSKTGIVLDRTCFYARGGGQDWDQGAIKKDTADFVVEQVTLDESGDVHHIGELTSGNLHVGDAVVCRVDHQRRNANTRLHSAAHVIDMAVDAMGLDWIGTKGQHYPDLSAVEYTGTWQPERANELRAEIEKRANDFITQGSTNSLKFIPVSEMHLYCRHVPGNIPKNKPGRVVMYGDDFGIPCGGTHVKDIHEVGTVYIPKLKEKKGVIRLSYTVEGINS